MRAYPVLDIVRYWGYFKSIKRGKRGYEFSYFLSAYHLGISARHVELRAPWKLEKLQNNNETFTTKTLWHFHKPQVQIY